LSDSRRPDRRIHWQSAVNFFGIHDPGFSLLGIDLLPAFVGAVIVAVAAEVYTTRRPIA
jgi:uncharacterized membrane protein YeaQ/YmgE (transglycosylase-associated protein family)